MKKALSIFLAVIMLISAVNFTAFISFAETSTDGKYDYSVSGGKATFVKFNNQSDTGSFTVPSKIGNYTVTAIEDFCFSQCSLSAITIPNSVVSIGNVAFEKCANLTSVTFGAGMEKFGTHVFSEVPKLASINVSSSNKYFKSVGGVLYNSDMSVLYAYPVAKADTHFTVPNSVKSVEAYAFDRALNLKTITIGTGLQTISDRAFIGAFNVESITILGAVTTIGNNAFGNIRKLTSINIPDTVSYIGKEAFQDNLSLKSIIIPPSVEYIGVDAFERLDTEESESLLVYCYSNSYAVSYCEKYKLDYELIDSVLSSLAITLQPTKTEYCKNSELDISGMVVSAIYSNGISRTVTRYDVSEFDSSTIGKKTLTVSFTDGGITCSANFSVDVVEHKWERIGEVSGSEPTCTEEGLDLYRCSVCGEEKTETAAALGHLYIDDVYIDPGCAEIGYKNVICDRCGEVVEEDVEIPALGHISDSYVKFKEATCTEPGFASGICTRCGEEFDDVIPELGHNMEEYTIEASCTSGGAVLSFCTRCGSAVLKQKIDKKEHSYKGAVKEATCTEPGYTVYVCENCNNTYIGDNAPALGHNYHEEVVAPTCSISGYSYYNCERCNDVYYGMFVEAKDHEYQTTTVNPTSVKMGYTLFECKYCDYSYYGDIKQPTGPTSVIASCSEYVEVGKTIKIKTDLTPSGIVDRVSFSSSNKKIATVSASGVITGKSVGTVKIKCYVSNGKYKTLTVKVKTPSTQISKLTTVAKGRLKVSWSQIGYADGYAVQVATDKNFKKNKVTKYINGKKNTSFTFKTLKSGKKYYVRVYAFKTISGQRSLSVSSKLKTIKVK